MIYLTGDTHGGMERFQSKEAKQLKKGDTLIICGDFGFIWDGSKGEEKHLKWLGKRRYTIAFVEGTHDNLDRLAGLPGRGVERRKNPPDFRQPHPSDAGGMLPGGGQNHLCLWRRGEPGH